MASSKKFMTVLAAVALVVFTAQGALAAKSIKLARHSLTWVYCNAWYVTHFLSSVLVIIYA